MDFCGGFPLLWTAEGIPAGNSDVNRTGKDLGRQLSFKSLFLKTARAQWKGSLLHFASGECRGGLEGELQGEGGRTQ